MKSLIVIAVLALSLTAVIAAPRTKNASKVQIRKHVDEIDLPEIVLAVEFALKGISAAADKAEASYSALLEGNPLKEVVIKLLRDAEADFQKVFEEAMVEALYNPVEELPRILRETFEKASNIQVAMSEAISDAIHRDSPELSERAYDIYFQMMIDLYQAMVPLFEIQLP